VALYLYFDALVVVISSSLCISNLQFSFVCVLPSPFDHTFHISFIIQKGLSLEPSLMIHSFCMNKANLSFFHSLFLCVYCFDNWSRKMTQKKDPKPTKRIW